MRSARHRARSQQGQERQFLVDGRMRNNLRMYWAKWLIAPTPDPETAWATACYMNDRLSLDGRDPATYGNIATMFGGGAPSNSDAPIHGRVPTRSGGSRATAPAAPNGSTPPQPARFHGSPFPTICREMIGVNRNVADGQSKCLPICNARPHPLIRAWPFSCAVSPGCCRV